MKDKAEEEMVENVTESVGRKMGVKQLEEATVTRIKDMVGKQIKKIERTVKKELKKDTKLALHGHAADIIMPSGGVHGTLSKKELQAEDSLMALLEAEFPEMDEVGKREVRKIRRIVDREIKRGEREADKRYGAKLNVWNVRDHAKEVMEAGGGLEATPHDMNTARSILRDVDNQIQDLLTSYGSRIGNTNLVQPAVRRYLGGMLQRSMSGGKDAAARNARALEALLGIIRPTEDAKGGVTRRVNIAWKELHEGVIRSKEKVDDYAAYTGYITRKLREAEEGSWLTSLYGGRLTLAAVVLASILVIALG